MRPPASNFADLIRQHFDPRDPSTFLDPAREFLEARSGSAPPLQPSAQQEDSVADDPAPEPESSGTITYPHPGGDLTGDGLEDVLVEEIDASDGSLALQALRGTDAEEIWRVELAGADDGFGYSVGDITGDGKDDMFIEAYDVLEVTESEECTETGCRYDYADRVMLYVGVRSGASGHKLWTKQYESTINFHQEYSYTSETTSRSYRYEDHLRTSNLFVVPLLSGDHDGDGVPDVVLDVVDYDWDTFYRSDTTGVPAGEIWVTGNASLQLADRLATRASIFSGDEGDRLALLTAPRAPSFSFLEPGQNVSGDAAPELLWSTWGIPDWSLSCEWVGVVSQCDESTAQPDFSLEILDGSSLEHVWVERLEGVYDAYVPRLDFDPSNDGIDDIVIWSARTDWETFTIDVIDGRDGRPIWTREMQEDQFPIVAGEYGGGAGADLIAVTLRWIPSSDPVQTVLEEDGETRIVLVRIDGSTGETLFETSRPLSWPAGSYDFVWPFIYGGGMPDADGDGQGDAYTGSWFLGFVEDPETGEFHIAGAQSDYRFESGASGSVLASAEGPGWFAVWPEPDLDGDGAADMSEWHYPIKNGEALGVKLWSLAPATALWERAIPAAEAWETTFWPSGDQDGIPGAEVLYGLNSEQDGRWSSIVASLTGATGTERWRQER